MKIGDKVKRHAEKCGRPYGTADFAFIKDKIYTVKDISRGNVTLEECPKYTWEEGYFDIVKPSTDELIQRGIQWIKDSREGKCNLCYDNLQFKFESVQIQFRGTPNLSNSVETFMKHNDLDYCVVLATENGKYMYPLEQVEYRKVDEFEEVKLNDSYTAKVYKDKVVVGCQEFPTSIIQDLSEAFKQIKEQ